MKLMNNPHVLGITNSLCWLSLLNMLLLLVLHTTITIITDTITATVAEDYPSGSALQISKYHVRNKKLLLLYPIPLLPHQLNTSYLLKFL